MDCFRSELCCKVTILQNNYRKMTILFPIIHGKKVWEPQQDNTLSKSVVRYKGTALCLLQKENLHCRSELDKFVLIFP